MTTANAIEVASVPRVLSVPLEAVVSDAGFSYVFKKDGRRVVRQMVETGEMNDNEIVVRRGVAAGDRVLLAPPADHASVQTVVIPGLQPITAPVAGGDTAKSAQVPAAGDTAKGARAPSAVPRAAAAAPAVSAPAAVASKH
jgi:hypothetical protein